MVASGSDLTALIIAVAMIGKFFATAAFDVTYLVTSEVFPTVLRYTIIRQYPDARNADEISTET